MDNAIELVEAKKGEIISKLVLKGDLSGLSEPQQVVYYGQLCESLGLNPITRPFQIITLQGKKTMYATKDATEQLRKINGVSITRLDSEVSHDMVTVTAYGCDKTGRTDASTGCVSIKGKSGDDLANAKMKAETKAKRRLTLSICGLGILDETELETIPGTVRGTEVNTVTGKEAYEDVKAQRLEAPKDEGDNPLEKRREVEAEIGRLASLISPEAVTLARSNLKVIHDMEKSGAIAWDESMEKVNALLATMLKDVPEEKELF